MKKLILLSFAVTLSLHASAAPEAWQIAQGENYAVVLPDRPIGSQTAYDTIMLDRNPPLGSLGPLKLDISECPRTVDAFHSIFNRLVGKNNLQAFLDDGPGIRVNVTCGDDRLMALIGAPAGAYAYLTNVVLPANLIRATPSVDEIAFVVAHEMSHVLLGHTELGLDIGAMAEKLGVKSKEFKELKYKHVSTAEPAADRLAAILMWNAGFNPACAGPALDNYTRFYNGKILSFLMQFLPDDGHGSSKVRQQKLKQQVLLPARLPTQCSKRTTTGILAAREELKALKQKPADVASKK